MRWARENQNLPAYVVLRDPDGYNNGGTPLWENGWLPALYRGTEIQSPGAAGAQSAAGRRRCPPACNSDNLDFLARLNEEHAATVSARIGARRPHSQLRAGRADAAGAERVLDLSGETPATRTLYGLDNPTTGLRHALPDGPAAGRVGRALRAGHAAGQVRSRPGTATSNIKPGIEDICPQVDLPSAALIRDLKQRGLAGLDDRAVDRRVRPAAGLAERQRPRPQPQRLQPAAGRRRLQGRLRPRPHRRRRLQGRRKPRQLPDLLATILHQLGLDHDRLTYLHHGRDESLTDSPVTGGLHVVRDLLDA